MDNKTKKHSEVGSRFPTLVGILVFLAWFATWYFLHDNNERGSFGDMFGTINALFTGLAFVGVIYAILLQSNELRLQREELKLTRNELEGQKIQLEAQNLTLKKQNFENTFFQLLSMQNDIIDSMSINKGANIKIVGRESFLHYYSLFEGKWKKNRSELRGSNEVEKINNTYLLFYMRYQHIFGHYFRSYYHVVKFVDSSEVNDKKFYMNLIRAQLSSYELLFLFYNSLSDMGRDKFKPLIEKYALLKTIPKRDLLDQEKHLPLFEKGAYNVK